MDEFHFIRPLWFGALLPLALWLLWAWRKKPRSGGNWEHACDRELLPFLLDHEQQQGSGTRWAGITLAVLITICALAGPTWEKLEQPVYNRGSALIIALDLSSSMNATDTSPSRLVRARHKLLDILAQRKEGQTALLVYTAQPFVVTPLTDDTDTIAALLPSLDTAMMPAQGTRTDRVITEAESLFKRAGISDGHLLLVTDSTGGVPNSAASLHSGNMRISVLAVGTSEGAPIPQADGGFLKDRSGQIVVPGLDLAALSELATRGGGRFALLGADDRDIEYLLAGMDGNTRLEDGEQSTLTTEQWQDQGPWLALLLVPLVALAFQRGYLVLLVVLLAPLPQDSYAFSWQDLWARPDQQARNSLEAGNPAEAAAQFVDPEWKAVASYQAGDYQQSLQSLKDLDSARAHYNRGNALARMGELEQAISAYEASLSRKPGDPDAQFNLDYVQKLLEQQQQQEQSDSSDDQQEGEQQQQQEGEQPSGDKQQDTAADEQSPGESGDGEQDREEQQTRQDQPGEQDTEQASETDGNTDDAQENHPMQEASEPDAEEQSAEEIMSETDSNDTEQTMEPEKVAASSSEQTTEQTEEDKAVEQWLKQIPDDPGGLLRRKFHYQYQRQHKDKTEQQPW